MLTKNNDRAFDKGFRKNFKIGWTVSKNAKMKAKYIKDSAIGKIKQN